MARGLDQEAVRPAYVLADLAVRLAIREPRDLDLPDGDAQVPADLVHQVGVRRAAEDLDASVHDLSRSGPGWGGRIRTSECGLQRPVSYHLTTPQSTSRVRVIPMCSDRQRPSCPSGPSRLRGGAVY